MPISALVVGSPLEPMPGVDLTCAGDRAAALALLAQRRFDAVLSRHKEGSERGLDLFVACMRAAPDMRRLLLADYGDLPEIVGARARGLVSRVIPLHAAPDKIAEALRLALLADDELSTSRSTVQGPALEALEELVRFSATRLAQVRGAIVRPLALDPKALQLQVVLRGNKRIESLRRDLGRRFGTPLKIRGNPLDPSLKGHPVLVRLGGLTPQAELWAHTAPSGKAFAYVALLPWSREPRWTAVVGIQCEQYRPEQWALLADSHRLAIDALAEFALPELSHSAKDERFGLAAPEYDWIVTQTYVGLDRRQTPTSFINRFVFFGRRRHVPTRLARATDSFTDRPPARVWRWFALYLAFASVDTALTYVCVRAGLVREANPLLRPLVLHHPVEYLLIKNGLAVVAFLIVSRFQLFRIGKQLLRAAVLAWVLLDLYWCVLLARHFSNRFTG